MLWGTCLVLILSACSRQEPPTADALDYFITTDLHFLTETAATESSKGWPATGCKEIEVKLKVPVLGEVSASFYHCCVNYACNMLELTNIVDFFLGDKRAGKYREVEILSSGMTSFRQYDFRILPGKYRLDLKTGKVEGLQYEVWVNRK